MSSARLVLRISMAVNAALLLYLFYPRKHVEPRIYDAKRPPISRSAALTFKTEAPLDLADLAAVKRKMSDEGFSDRVIQEVIRQIGTQSFDSADQAEQDRVVSRMRRWNQNPEWDDPLLRKETARFWEARNAAGADALAQAGFTNAPALSKGLSAVGLRLGSEQVLAVQKIEAGYAQSLREAREADPQFVSELAGVLSAELLNQYLAAAFPGTDALSSLLRGKIEVSEATQTALTKVITTFQDARAAAGNEGLRQIAAAEGFVVKLRETLGDPDLLAIAPSLDKAVASVDLLLADHGWSPTERADLFVTAFRARRTMSLHPDPEQRRSTARTVYAALTEQMPENVRQLFDQSDLAQELIRNRE